MCEQSKLDLEAGELGPIRNTGPRAFALDPNDPPVGPGELVRPGDLYWRHRAALLKRPEFEEALTHG